ncbi:apolipoprotein N-acyltransferase [Knoellia sp. 3-2P3]|uniref:apolipoprotein N-acyltransferase n=1 Tax=unclassified Knoellia TaxID=2618719 RepID=UPI0023DC6407|nr:apolipoprotein N-acyltransferase [Knoellia sp. 3-2P3]MDF2092031.1 apolipoprotein N-acyltransferase [Knoellia sp. 3-2P3]
MPTDHAVRGLTLRAGHRLVLAVASGLVLVLAFPTYDHFWLAPVAVALLSAAVLGASWRVASGSGLVAGLAFFLPTLSWSGVYVGALPWVALCVLQALYIAVMAGVTAAVQRPLLGTRLQPLAYAAVPLFWVLQETARSHTPFGGFPWARLAFSQADSPLAPLAASVGAPGVTASVAALGALLHATVVVALGRIRRLAGRRSTVPGSLTALAVSLALVLLAVVPAVAALAATPPTGGRGVPVMFVQGNVPRAGLDFNAERRQVLDNHVQQTLRGLAAGEGEAPSLVVWPENASDIDPLRNADAEAAIRSAVEAAGVPVLVGAVLREPAPMLSNASLLYRPGGGQPERYVKQHPVPFAEYIPYRSFFRTFSDKVDLVTADFTGGEDPAAFEVPVASGGSYSAIPTICFEVAYDDLMREATLAPGRGDSLLVVQTNNATFGYTAESEQQFAISRLRAIEHGRSVVHVSTVGVSAFIRPDGSYEDKTRLFTGVAAHGEPVVRSSLTVSDRIGDLPEYTAAALAALLVTAAAATSRARGRRAARVQAEHREEEEAVVV